MMRELITLSERHESVQAKTKRQQRMIATHSLPLITLTTYLPDSMLGTDIATQLFKAALESVEECLKTLETRVVKCVVTNQATGLEAMMVVNGLTSTQLKKAMIQLENQHPLGALINADVLHQDGKTISRKSGFLAPRKCSVCDEIASRCASSGRHSDEQLAAHVYALFREFTAPVMQQHEAVA
jgi:holo-ACP synthase